MRDDRFAPPSYVYEPPPAPVIENDRGLMVTTVVMWGFLFLVAACELWAALNIEPQAMQ